MVIIFTTHYDTFIFYLTLEDSDSLKGEYQGKAETELRHDSFGDSVGSIATAYVLPEETVKRTFIGQ